jgi:NTP pyrophosphatase (non-canonical NTP hydrolase)
MNEDTREILLILQEECAEVTQAISKCFRFGPDQVKPNSSNNQTNVQALQEELGDLLAMIELLVDKDVGVTDNGLMKAKKNKFDKLKQWSNIAINK